MALSPLYRQPSASCPCSADRGMVDRHPCGSCRSGLHRHIAFENHCLDSPDVVRRRLEQMAHPGTILGQVPKLQDEPGHPVPLLRLWEHMAVWLE